MSTLKNSSYLWLFLLGLLSLNSCRYISLKKDVDNPILAKVYEETLYFNDIQSIIPKAISKEDSLVFLNNYVNNWARQRLLLYKAKLNLNEDKLAFDNLVTQYKEDLYVNKYKEAVIKQYLDTVVNVNEIEEFYSKNQDNFKLNENLVKLKYIQFGNNVLNPKEFIRLFKSNKKNDLYKLDDLRLQLKSASLNDSVWISYNDVIAKIPFLKNENSAQILKKSNIIEKKDSLGLYLVAIKDVLNINDTAPISYVTPTIIEIILHKRELNLIKNLQETLTKDAIKNNEFEIFIEN